MTRAQIDRTARAHDALWVDGSLDANRLRGVLAAMLPEGIEWRELTLDPPATADASSDARAIELASRLLETETDGTTTAPWRAWTVRVHATRHLVVLANVLASPVGQHVGRIIEELAIHYTKGEAALEFRVDAAKSGSLGDEHGERAATTLELPVDHPHRAEPDLRAAAVEKVIEGEPLRNLRAAKDRAGVSLFALMQAGLYAVLHRYTGQEDIVVDVRPRGRVTSSSGRSHFEDGTTFAALCRIALPNEGALDPKASPRQVLLTELTPWSTANESVRFERTFVSSPRIPHELAASFRDDGDRLVLRLEYRRELFEPSTASRTLGHWETIASAGAREPDRSIASLPLLTEREEQELLVAWNDTTVALPSVCLHELFEQQVARSPDAIAVEFGSVRLSYRELDARAGRVAATLRQLGVGPDTLVGLCVERSVELAIGVLGILKAGAAYVPLDPAYPHERLAWILTDARAPVVLTQRSLTNALPEHEARVIYLDDPLPETADAAPGPRPNPSHIAYVIYTSGSTGRPKGICLPHAALVNLIRWHDRTLLGGARTLQFASICFDASCHEMFAAWSSGGTVVLVTEAVRRDVAALTRFIYDSRIEKVILPVVVLQQMAEHYGNDVEKLRSLREVTTTGEQLHVTTPIIRLFQKLSGCVLHNHYGPSETHVVTAFTLPEDPSSWPSHPPIGRAIDNSSLYILDRHGHPVPVGVPGELYIGGVSLARCYQGRPDLTAERFVPNRFSKDSAERLYRTGDLCRFRSDGAVEFLGRIDHQVKIRGHRVELGEIEGTLTRHPSVREAVVMARQDAGHDRRLVAYVVPEHAPTADTAAARPRPLTAMLRAHLRDQLPDYMVPAAIVTLASFPLTANGKVDRRALPVPGPARPELEQPYVAPRTELEASLVEIWREALKLDRIGVLDNFFDLGGDSLCAVEIFARIRQRLSVEVSFATLFAEPTVAQLAERVATAARCEATPITAVPRTGQLPLSFAQERLWFLHRFAPASPAYNCPYFFRLRGALDHDALATSVRDLVRRHEVLRTTFSESQGRSWQHVQADLALDFERLDLRSKSGSAREEELAAYLSAEANRPFDLTRGPLVRAGSIVLAEDEHAFWINLHHIVTDGRSMAVVFREIEAGYRAARAKQASDLSTPALHYADYASWQRATYDDDTLATLGSWWREQLAGAPPLLALPVDHPRPPVQSFRGGALDFSLDGALTDALRALGVVHGTTLTMVVLAGFAALLHRYTGQDDLVIGIPSIGRDRLETENLLGFFVNTLPLRLRLGDRPRFADLLRQVRLESLDAFEHDAMPFERIVQELRVDRAASHNPVVQVAISPQPPGERDLRLDGLSVEHLDVASHRAAFDLTLFCWDTPAGMSGRFEYSSDLFERATIERLVEHFVTFLAGAAAEPEGEVRALAMLTDAERRKLADWNHTEGPAPDARTFHERFAAQAARAPERIAVSEPSGRTLTYAELDARANRLAHHLREQGVGPDDLVAVCMDRSAELIVGILGILKAGGAYLPLDPTYPAARLAFMASDAKPRALVTQAHLEALVPGIANVVRVDSDADAIARRPATAPPNRTEPHHLAYVIYTSGSTGQPKGAMLEHRNLVNLAEAQRIALEMTADARVLQFSALSFDAAVWELATTLTVGAALCLLPPGPALLGAELGRLIRDQRITVATLVPSVLPDIPVDLLASLQTLVVAGEPCSAELVERFGPGRRFINAYGPTECAVCATLAVCEPGGAPPIGRPLANVRVHVLDESKQPVPIGVVGELYIGGAGVGRGYLNRPELTAERFHADPFDPPAPGGRMYRSGDLVRWRSDGNLEFIGRADAQVKVRGFRIELGEIEAAIREHDGVADVAVVARAGGASNARLAAYVVPAAASKEADGGDAGRNLTSILRSALQARLPGYMVPAEIAVLKALPLAPSGKVDRAALAAMAPERSASDETFVPPRNALERDLVRLWAEVLKVPRVGIHNDFFALGGDSLMVPRLMLRVEEIAGFRVPMHVLFEAPTIARLAALLETRRHAPDLDSLCYSPELVLEEEAALAPEVNGRGLPGATGAEPEQVLLTGATGFVGAHLLSELLTATSWKIHCLVRARDEADALRRLRDSLASYSLPTDTLDGRVKPVLGDLGTERLGLDEATFERLATTIDAIYHNGAKVDHVRGYAAMKPANILGTHEVLRLASRGRYKPVHFISTLGTIHPGHYRAEGIVREDAPAGPLAELPNGYMQSKCVAEHMVNEAIARGIPASIYRLGAITGHTVTGACNPSDYTHSAIRSTIQLGFADDLDSDLTLTPVDFTARAIVALSRWKGAAGKVMHITNPRAIFWLELIDLLKQYGYALRMVSYAECMDGLLDAARRGIDTPMLAFLPFALQRVPGTSRYVSEDYYAPVRWDCERSLAGLTEMGVAPPPEPRRMVRSYLDYMVQHGYVRPPQTTEDR